LIFPDSFNANLVSVLDIIPDVTPLTPPPVKRAYTEPRLDRSRAFTSCFGRPFVELGSRGRVVGSIV